MTAQDYRILAAAVSTAAAEIWERQPNHRATSAAAVGTVIRHLSDALALDNPRFDREKFLEACIRNVNS
jgi:hypothetical protein